MAFTAANLQNDTGMPPGRATYTYHTADNVNTVEAGGYFNNVDDLQKLAPGDRINVIIWDGTPHATGQLPVGYSLQLVTTVDPAGVVNTAEAGISSAGALSSGA